MPLLAEALKAGISVAEFWEMTPRETFAAVEAAAWRMRQEQMLALSTAWHTAALSRAKKLPALAVLMARMKDGGRPKTEDRGKLAERRREFNEMKERMIPHLPTPSPRGRRGENIGAKEEGRGNRAPTAG